jgi:diguanylate cyclase (GGDEF)-like protein
MYDNMPEVKREKLTVENRYIAMLDVDDFKKINDTKGHTFGDKVLADVAKAIQEMVSVSDGEIAARYGGEEFVCILGADNPEQALRRMNNIRENIAALEWEEYPGFSVTVSGGVVSCEEEPDISEALHDVDELLYRAKAEGKNKILT